MPAKLKAPSTYTEYAYLAFMANFGPMKNSVEIFEQAVRTNAYHVERVPDENVSVWTFKVPAGPQKGFMAYMVVSADGTVQTVLPHSKAMPDPPHEFPKRHKPRRKTKR